ncbi:MAG: hypothetical protein SRB2_04478 [Desulfobacteraceae bacterium Eth-SRB2]|nr:MAG: hypothetical protein SRB2_04478 [Desulfobacteraceae bacterium Eth-SRB2]
MPLSGNQRVELLTVFFNAAGDIRDASGAGNKYFHGFSFEPQTLKGQQKLSTRLPVDRRMVITFGANFGSILAGGFYLVRSAR